MNDNLCKTIKKLFPNYIDKQEYKTLFEKSCAKNNQDSCLSEIFLFIEIKKIFSIELDFEKTCLKDSPDFIIHDKNKSIYNLEVTRVNYGNQTINDYYLIFLRKLIKDDAHPQSNKNIYQCQNSKQEFYVTKFNDQRLPQEKQQLIGFLFCQKLITEIQIKSNFLEFYTITKSSCLKEIIDFIQNNKKRLPVNRKELIEEIIFECEAINQKDIEEILFDDLRKNFIRLNKKFNELITLLDLTQYDTHRNSILSIDSLIIEVEKKFKKYKDDNDNNVNKRNILGIDYIHSHFSIFRSSGLELKKIIFELIEKFNKLQSQNKYFDYIIITADYGVIESLVFQLESSKWKLIEHKIERRSPSPNVYIK